MGDMFVNVKNLTGRTQLPQGVIDANSKRTRDYNVDARATVDGVEQHVYFTREGWDRYESVTVNQSTTTNALVTEVSRDAHGGWIEKLAGFTWSSLFGATPPKDPTTRPRHPFDR